tara:strand:- start:616 stop:1026 length:411 start_codon:yes stop_codon:yes gene_type:complete
MNWIKRFQTFGGDTNLYFGSKSSTVSKSTIIKQEKADKAAADRSERMIAAMTASSQMEAPAMPSMPKAPPIPPPVSPPTQGDASQAGTDAKQQALRRKGMASSILAGETGGNKTGTSLASSSYSTGATKSKKTLLG